MQIPLKRAQIFRHLDVMSNVLSSLTVDNSGFSNKLLSRHCMFVGCYTCSIMTSRHLPISTRCGISGMVDEKITVISRDIFTIRDASSSIVCNFYPERNNGDHIQYTRSLKRKITSGRPPAADSPKAHANCCIKCSCCGKLGDITRQQGQM